MENRIPVLIVDDLKPDREVLAKKIELYCPQLTIVELCANVEQTKIAIARHQPKILFLDIALGTNSVFEWLNNIDTFQLNIIFVSGKGNFDNISQALDVRPYGFVHKPIVKEKLIEAVQKAIKKINTEVELTISILQLETLTLYNKVESYKTIRLNEIVYIQSDEHLLHFYFTSGKRFTITAKLDDYERKLSSKGFFRVQQSYLVNTQHIDKLLATEKKITLKYYPNLVIPASRNPELWTKLLAALKENK